MQSTDLVASLITPTTRRHVVKTGVKLAYAAPLVVATMGLDGSDALAKKKPTLIKSPVLAVRAAKSVAHASAHVTSVISPP